MIFIVQIKYKEEIQHATAISDPPELRRVKENQKNISNVCPVFIACSLCCVKCVCASVNISVMFVLVPVCSQRLIN